jgi:hypothetical protein
LSCDLALRFVIDLDGTLVPTNTLHEAVFLLLKREWSKVWRIPLWTYSFDLKREPIVHVVMLAALSTMRSRSRGRGCSSLSDRRDQELLSK